jgi:putative transposase
MARLPRFFVRGLSVHVIQKGNNGTAVFGDHTDYETFLTLLRAAAHEHDVAIHAYVLMTNHFHLIVTPQQCVSLPGMMRTLDGEYVRFFNDKYARTGTLWNGRYRALLLDTESYWLTCLRYIEQNPVRAGMVTSPDEHCWSSYAAHALGRWPAWLSPHPVYLALGKTGDDRQRVYRAIWGQTGVRPLR